MMDSVFERGAYYLMAAPTVKSTPDPRVRRTRAERRVQIAEATLQLVGEFGVPGTTTARIAEAVGISGPALYKHFSNRSEILEAAMDLLQQRVFSWLDSSTNPDAIERLRELGTGHVSTIAADYEGVIAPLFEFVAATPRSHLSEQMGKRQRAALQRFIDIVDQGKMQGTIREEVDSKVVAWSLMGLSWMENFAILEGLDEFITEGTSARMLDWVLGEIAAPPPEAGN
ncbi:MAG TPA: TetR/AcrR family transcriptional regulator [Thermoleophilia bacterium]